MQKTLLEFFAALRGAGLPVSISEGLDAVQAVSLLDVGERSLVQAALRSTLVKRLEDQSTFDTVFDAFFINMLAQLLPAAPDESAEEVLDRVDDLLANAPLSSLANITSPWQVGGATRALIDGMQNGDGQDPMTQARTWVEQGRQRFYSRERQQFQREQLLTKSFFAFDRRDVESATSLVRSLARRLKAGARRRAQKVRRGRLDMQRTLRVNMRFGGVPFVCKMRRRRYKEPRLVVLCDISPSVEHAARFMLLLLYCLQEVVEKTTAMVFAGDIADVTDLFQLQSAEAAIAQSMAGAGRISPYARTNYGHVFEQFCAKYLEILTPRTTMIILGDARNNHYAEGTDALAQIQQRCGRMIWLNPERQFAWGLGDSLMRTYARYMTAAHECQNLQQLDVIVRELFTGGSRID